MVLQMETETRNGRDYPVFDALDLWQPSQYSTFEVSLNIPDQRAEDRLVELCKEHKMGVEDWSTLRMLCAECSRGNPGIHECKQDSASPHKSYALAVKSESDLRIMLTEWVAETAGAHYGSVDLVLKAEANGVGI